jgi:hypothetical protein
MAVNRGSMGRGFSFGTTSDNPHPLTRDDGGTRQTGSVRADHAIDSEHSRPHSKGFNNPETDYGPSDLADVDHIDRSMPQYPRGAGYTPQPDRRGPGASVARAKAGSDSEWWPDTWYGYPSKRQGG